MCIRDRPGGDYRQARPDRQPRAGGVEQRGLPRARRQRRQRLRGDERDGRAGLQRALAGAKENANRLRKRGPQVTRATVRDSVHDSDALGGLRCTAMRECSRR
eukprot:4890527-Pyramimonas_sp.AAC.1